MSRQKRLQSLQIVPMDDEIVVQTRLGTLRRQGLLRLHPQFPERNAEVVRVDKLFPFEIKRGHGRLFYAA